MSDTYEKIVKKLNKSMEMYTDSRHPTDDEVSIAWLICEIDRLRTENAELLAKNEKLKNQLRLRKQHHQECCCSACLVL
jgi:hypothetical protein